MFSVNEAEAAAIRAAYEQDGEMSAAVVVPGRQQREGTGVRQDNRGVETNAGQVVKGTRKQLVIALAAIAGGVLAFVLYLGVTGHGDDGQTLGLLDWVILGVLIAPGFGLLLRWRAGRSR